MVKIQDDRSLKLSGVYCLICLVNSKIYFGKTNNLRKRSYDYKFMEKDDKNISINNAIRKYGWNNFRIFLIKKFDILEQKEMLDFESFLIKIFNTTDRKIGYNTATYSNDCSGIKLSQNHKDKISKTMKNSNRSGKNNPFYGKTHNSDVKTKISNTHKNKKQSKEHIEKRMLSKKITMLNKLKVT